MSKKKHLIPFLFLISLSLSSCNAFGNNTISISNVYLTTALLAALLLVSYFFVAKKYEIWFILLFSSVAVVNVGYAWLSRSLTLGSALWANRISYLGSVFLPIAMLMIILKTTKINYHKLVPIAAITLGVIAFSFAATPGFSDIYYKEVSLIFENGASLLKKEYGSWHDVYLYYLIIAFASMIAALGYSIVEKKLCSTAHAAFLVIAVFVNIGVWLIEQLVDIGFEMLSVSYIITELFLLALDFLVSEAEAVKPEEVHTTIKKPVNVPTVPEEIATRYNEGLKSLTKTEKVIYDMYVNGSTTKDIMSHLCITENTVKFHNKNIYGKLGVCSRKQLLLIASALNEKKASN